MKASRKTGRKTDAENIRVTSNRLGVPAISISDLIKNDSNKGKYYYIYNKSNEQFIRNGKNKVAILYTGTGVLDPARAHSSIKQILIALPETLEYKYKQYNTNDNLVFFEASKANILNNKNRLLTELCIQKDVNEDCQNMISLFALNEPISIASTSTSTSTSTSRGITNKSNNKRRERRESRKQRKRKRRRTIRRT